MERKRIFLTGGSGFIGKNLRDQLGSKYDFVSPSHKDLELTDASAVEQFLNDNPVDVIIHTANIGGDRKTNHLPNIAEINLRMFFNIIRAKKPNTKLIFCGSGAEYDKSEDIVNVSEDDFGKKIPKDAYGLYKYICSKILENLDNVVSFRIFGLYGNHEDKELRFISNSILKALRGEAIELWQNVKFDYVYIDDFVQILDFAIENKMKEKFYNLGSGRAIELLELAKIVNKVTGNGEKIKIKDSGMGREYTCNSSKLRAELKDFKFKGYEAGIQDLVKLYDKN